MHGHIFGNVVFPRATLWTARSWYAAARLAATGPGPVSSSPTGRKMGEGFECLGRTKKRAKDGTGGKLGVTGSHWKGVEHSHLEGGFGTVGSS